MGFLRIFGGYFWDIYGIFMGFLRIFVGYLWDILGMFYGFFDGGCLGHLREI